LLPRPGRWPRRLPPSPTMVVDHRGPQRQAALGRAGDGLGLAALLGADARIGAGGVDEGDHRQVEALGHVHQAHGLAVALGPGHAEVVLQAGGGVVALLVAHDHDRDAAEAAQAADDGLVVGELAVAAQLDELVDQGRACSPSGAAARDGGRPWSSARRRARSRPSRAASRRAVRSASISLSNSPGPAVSESFDSSSILLSSSAMGRSKSR
jgi:hypothetical protein